MSLDISESTEEARRLAALYELEILDTTPEEDYDNIVALAGQITDTELGMLVFLDQDRVWYKSKMSLPVADGYHNMVFWAFREPTKELFILPDMDTDPRSADHPFVTGPPFLRYAVLVPLVTDEGLILGHLAVGDNKPRDLSERALEGLRMLGNQVMSLLKLRVELIKSKKMESESRMELNQTNIITLELDKQKEFYENILNKIPTDIAVFDANHRYVFVNPGAIKNDELRQYIIGKDDFEYAAYRNRDDTVAKLRRAQFQEAKSTGKEIRWQDSIRNAEGEVLTTLRRLFPVYDEKGALSLLIGFGIDITDRILMEEKQSALVKQLSAQNTQLLDFCNIVSHNLRGPLINMSMLVEFIEESADAEEQKLLVSKLNPVIESLNTTFNELVE